MTPLPISSAHACPATCACDRPRQRLGRAAAGAALLAVFPLGHALMPFLLRDRIIICPFRALTGKPCPLCGLTRAIACATHGRWRQAFRLNPLWPLFAVAILTFGLLLLADALTGADRAGR